MFACYHLNHFAKNVYQLNPGLKKGTTRHIINKNILDEMNINKAREIQIVSNPFSSSSACSMTTTAAPDELVQTVPVYQISDFEAITWNGFECELPQQMIDLISRIADQVGAPSYVKTPVFPKRDKPEDQDKQGQGPVQVAARKKPRNTTTEITEDDWESIRTFQATELKKRQGIDAHLYSIRSDLNKITDKTYDEVFAALCARIDDLMDEPDATHLLTVGEAIFNTASSNHFFSAVYARLFRQLLHKYNAVFRTVFETNFEQFMSLFKTIEHADAKKDYTRFCEVNKTNDKRRAMSLFIINLMKEGVVATCKVLDIVQQLQSLIREHLRQSDRTNEVEELTENLFIILKDAHQFLRIGHADEWTTIVHEVEYTSQLKPKNTKYPSVTNKTIFKHMDILDELKKTK
jgi:uncharacterized protein YqgV (UPF0045/DUF77 family)